MTVAGIEERLRRLGMAELTGFPRSYLLSKPELAEWHEFWMEWKEHVAWLAAILATAVAFVVTRYGSRLAQDTRIRNALILLFTVAFGAAAVAGLLGAFLNKAAPIRAWKDRRVNSGAAYFVALILLILGLLGTFPPVFEAFE